MNSFLARFGLFNVFCVATMFTASYLGWTREIIAADSTGITAGLFILFLLGWTFSLYRAGNLHEKLNNPGYEKKSYIKLGTKLTSSIAWVRHIATLLVVFGLIGTVVGFMHALSGVNPGTAADVNAVSSMVSSLVDGMATALNTTLIGGVLGVWLSTNHHMLTSAIAEILGHYSVEA